MLSVAELQYLCRLMTTYIRKNLINSDIYDIVDYVQQGDTLVVTLALKEYYSCD